MSVGASNTTHWYSAQMLIPFLWKLCHWKIILNSFRIVWNLNMNNFRMKSTKTFIGDQIPFKAQLAQLQANILSEWSFWSLQPRWQTSILQLLGLPWWSSSSCCCNFQGTSSRISTHRRIARRHLRILPFDGAGWEGASQVVLQGWERQPSREAQQPKSEYCGRFPRELYEIIYYTRLPEHQTTYQCPPGYIWPRRIAQLCQCRLPLISSLQYRLNFVATLWRTQSSQDCRRATIAYLSHWPPHTPSL